MDMLELEGLEATDTPDKQSSASARFEDPTRYTPDATREFGGGTSTIYRSNRAGRGQSRFPGLSPAPKSSSSTSLRTGTSPYASTGSIKQRYDRTMREFVPKPFSETFGDLMAVNDQFNHDYGFQTATPIAMIEAAATSTLNTQFHYRAPNVSAELKAASQIRLVRSVSGVLGTALGVAGLISHGSEAIDNIRDGSYIDAGASVLKMGVDAVFLGAKLSNPFVFAGSLVYGFMDSQDLLTPSHYLDDK